MSHPSIKRILLTNDDGIHAPGIQALFQVLSVDFDVMLVAPLQERSGSSSKLTLNRPLTVHEMDSCQYAIDGSPADAAYLGLNGLFSEPFDLVVSGINRGANLADDVLYSGTIGAASEGRFLSHTPIAISLAGEDVKDLKMISDYLPVAKWLNHWIYSEYQCLPPKNLWSINVPYSSTRPIMEMPVQYTAMGQRAKPHSIEAAYNPRSSKSYWIGKAGEPVFSVYPTDAIYDLDCIREDKISVTPLMIDRTNYAVLDRLKLRDE